MHPLGKIRNPRRLRERARHDLHRLIVLLRFVVVLEMSPPVLAIERDVVVAGDNEFQLGVEAAQELESSSVGAKSADLSEIAAVEENVDFWEGLGDGRAVGGYVGWLFEVMGVGEDHERRGHFVRSISGRLEDVLGATVIF